MKCNQNQGRLLELIFDPFRYDLMKQNKSQILFIFYKMELQQLHVSLVILCNYGNLIFNFQYCISEVKI